ncbi:helix-turn-helix domain-containing protein [Clostridioides difficile]|nr:XRE family transcriptional regulator [Clostridioides difficile]EKG0799226.1 helix-turn-helix transcriptional regulator [Clostridioides difficile]EKS6830845.1 helix-turn-helix transcriptional regulator [Clostridioides difficile]MBY2252328.1 helix-turn-helix domain-containing protein [Clostridioides difficile]MCI2384803.1 helix-turn-helix domain-containing protein [Clostridioides difficile]
MYYDVKESGKRIKKLRNISQLTQRELAEKINISHSMMAKIEQGTKMVSVDLGIEIAEYFDVTLDYLFLGREMKTEKLEAQLEAAINIIKNVKANL